MLAILPAGQVLGTNAMIMTDNNYPNTAKVVGSIYCLVRVRG